MKRYLFDINTHKERDVMDTYIPGRQFYSNSNNPQFGGELPYEFSREKKQYKSNFDDNFQFIAKSDPPHGIFDPRTVFDFEHNNFIGVDLNSITKTDNNYVENFYSNYKHLVYPYARKKTLDIMV